MCEYLDALDNPIAKADDVCEYVRRFRPESSDGSISSNLMQESNRKFVVLQKEGVRYFGYSGRDYGPMYRIIVGERPLKRSTEESMRLLEEFILANGHFPYGNDANEEEYRLYRFVGNRRSAYKRGALQEQEAEDWKTFENRYREYNIPRERKRRS